MKDSSAGTEEEDYDNEDVPTSNEVDEEDDDDYEEEEVVVLGIKYCGSHICINHCHTCCGSSIAAAVASSLNCCTAEGKDQTTIAQTSAI